MDMFWRTHRLRGVHRLLGCVAFMTNVCAVLFAPRVAAHTPAAVDAQPMHANSIPAEYEEMIDRGVAESNRGNHHRARQFFTSAHAIAPSARTLRALGMTDFALDNYDLAQDALRRALASSAKPLTAEQRAEVTQLLAWMHDNLAVVRLHCVPADAKAEIDSKPVASGDLLLEPGTHELRITAPGFGPHEQRFKLIAADSPLELRVSLTKQPEGAREPLESPRAQPAAEPSSAWLWVGGASAATLLAGGALIISGRMEFDRAEDPARATSITDADAERERGRLLMGLGIGAAAASVVGFVTAILLKIDSEPAERERAALQLTIAPAQVVLEGSF